MSAEPCGVWVEVGGSLLPLEDLSCGLNHALAITFHTSAPSSLVSSAVSSILLFHLTMALFWPLTPSPLSYLFLVALSVSHDMVLCLCSTSCYCIKISTDSVSCCSRVPSLFIDVWSNCFCSDPGHSVTSSQRIFCLGLCRCTLFILDFFQFPHQLFPVAFLH